MFRSKSIPRAVFYLGLVSLFGDIASEAIYPLLPFFLTKNLGVSVVFVGLLEGTAEAIASLTKIFSGYFSDKFKNKYGFVLAGYIISTFRSLIGVVSAPWQVLAIRFADRFGKGVRTAPRDAWLASFTNATNRGRIFGFHRRMDHLGATLAPLLATAFLFFFPEEYRILFLLTFIPGILGLLSIMKAIRESKAEDLNNKTPTEEKKIIRLKDLSQLPKSFQYYLLVLIFFTLGNSADAFLILKLKDAGVSEIYIPALWSALNLIKMISTLWAGGFSDRVGPKRAILLGWMVYGACYLCFSLSLSLPIVILAFLFYGIYFGLTEAPEKSIVTALAPTHLRGTAFGLYHLIVGVGMLPASYIAGILWKNYGPTFGLGFAVLTSIIAIFLFLPFKVSEVKNA